MTYNNHWGSLASLSDKITISSAYSKMDKSLSPFDAPHSKSFTVCAKSLINILNNNGDKMQPCFNPILTSN